MLVIHGGDMGNFRKSSVNLIYFAISTVYHLYHKDRNNCPSLTTSWLDNPYKVVELEVEIDVVAVFSKHLPR